MDWKEHKKKLLEDPEFKKEYEALATLNLKEAARYLGVSDIKIQSLISKGLLTVSLDPLDDRKRLVKRSEVDTHGQARGTS